MMMINKDALEAAKVSYSDQALRMKNLKVKLENAVADLGIGWQSDAGDEFFKKFEDEWVCNVNNYIDVIGHVANNINSAKLKYQEIFDEADKIKLY